MVDGGANGQPTCATNSEKMSEKLILSPYSTMAYLERLEAEEEIRNGSLQHCL
jgi:hypothetical protein